MGYWYWGVFCRYQLFCSWRLPSPSKSTISGKASEHFLSPDSAMPFAKAALTIDLSLSLINDIQEYDNTHDRRSFELPLKKRLSLGKVLLFSIRQKPTNAKNLLGFWVVESLDVQIGDLGCFKKWLRTFIPTDSVGMLEVASGAAGRKWHSGALPQASHNSSKPAEKDKKKAVQNELIDYTIAQLIMSSCHEAHNM